ncbi:unnamed protein product [Pleuronectes platessa]|uniref:Uncharacterized protein n=1 Tax=Pleuronectes platessa TaxID=8262 RepID=A0A9N7U5E5_PLEPL|nr:unnamed protein product [Pleuronectes platessa]
MKKREQLASPDEHSDTISSNTSCELPPEIAHTSPHLPILRRDRMGRQVINRQEREGVYGSYTRLKDNTLYSEQDICVFTRASFFQALIWTPLGSSAPSRWTLALTRSVAMIVSYYTKIRQFLSGTQTLF